MRYYKQIGSNDRAPHSHLFEDCEVESCEPHTPQSLVQQSVL